MIRNVRILVVEYRDINHPEAGGAELILFEVFGRLAQRGHQIDYLCTRHERAGSEGKLRGINVIHRGNPLSFNFAVPRVYRNELKGNDYDLIVEGIDKIPYFLPLFEKNVPIICIIPHLFGTTIFDEVSFLLGSYVYFYELFIPRVYKNAHFSVLSESTRDDLIARGISEEKIRVIHPGINHSRYAASPEKTKNDRPTVIYLGRIKKYKGVDIGIRAISLLRETYPNIDYQIIGSGDYLNELRKLATQLNLEQNVSFLGFVAGREKVELLQKAHVLIYPSPKEGWGLTVIEANACGTPVVASHSPGLRDSVQNGKTGFLVQHGDVEALAGKINELLRDERLYDSMRTNAIEWAKEFSWEKTTKETFEFITEILEQKNKRFP